ncbi:MAG TPA: cytochrome c [Sphingobacterium bovisgrunnientis]|nr:cytochrome c [Sphingobacterium bovisgrunnientis]
MIKLMTFTLICFFIFSAIKCVDNTDKSISYQIPHSEGDWKENLNTYKSTWPEKFDIGNKATSTQIEKWDIDISPDGTGLPKGEGLAKNGKLIYENKCSSCHGKNGYEGPYDQLVTVDTSSKNTIGNYWPYATTIFDYVRRAMPFNAPGSLSNKEVYDLTAYLLYLNKIIEKDFVIDAHTLPNIEMPARSKFVLDDRRGGNEIK